MVNNYSTKVVSKLMDLDIVRHLDLDIKTVVMIEIEDESVGELSEINFDMDLGKDSIGANMVMILRCKKINGGLVEVEIKSSGMCKSCDIKQLRLIQNIIYIYTRDYIINNVKTILNSDEIIPMNLHRYISGNRSYTRKDGAVSKLKNLIDFNHFCDSFKLFFRR